MHCIFWVVVDDGLFFGLTASDGGWSGLFGVTTSDGGWWGFFGVVLDGDGWW